MTWARTLVTRPTHRHQDYSRHGGHRLMPLSGCYWPRVQSGFLEFGWRLNPQRHGFSVRRRVARCTVRSAPTRGTPSFRVAQRPGITPHGTSGLGTPPLTDSMGTMYGVVSETSTVARSRRPGQGIGPRRIASTPGPLAHALTSRNHTLCGRDASNLISWPGLEFAEVDVAIRCPRCTERLRSLA